MGDLVRSIELVWVTTPWLGALALAGLIGRIAAIYLGIRDGAAATALPRISYFLFCIVYSVLIFVAGGLALMTGVGFNIGNGYLLLVYLVDAVGSYFLAGASVRRLADISWSRNWAWLLIFDGIVTPFMLVLWFVPGKSAKIRTAVPCA